MAVVWDEIYDHLQSGSRGPEEALDKQGHLVAIHHHHHHFLPPDSESQENRGTFITDRETHTTIAAVISRTAPADVCETKLAYHIDIEVPGVADTSAFKFYWLDPRTFLIEAKATPRASVLRGREESGDAIWEEETKAENAAIIANSESQSSDNDGGVLQRCPSTPEEKTTGVILAERERGPWRRKFTLPTDMDMKTAKARVELGLLHICVLKKKVG